MLRVHAHKNTWQRIALALILGGAVGNLIDRALLGYVVDFIDVRIWPVFNIADSAITVGAVLLCIHYLRGERSCIRKSAP
jgi:signal peptidase II